MGLRIKDVDRVGNCLRKK